MLIRPALRCHPACIIHMLLVISCLLLGSCSGNNGNQSEPLAGKPNYLFDEADFETALQQLLPAETRSDTTLDTGITTALRAAYQQRAYKPVWIAGDGILARAKTLVDELDSLWLDGLVTDDFQTARIRSQLMQADKVSDKDALNFALDFDTTCTRAYLLASRQLLFGRITPRRADSLWFHDNDTAWHAPLVLGNPDAAYVSLDTFRSRFPGYRQMRDLYRAYHHLKTDSAFLIEKGTENSFPEMIKRLLPAELYAAEDSALVTNYQRWRGLKPTGKADSATLATLQHSPDTLLDLLAINMERARWLPQHLATNAIIVNVPAMELILLDDGRQVMHMRAVVGKKSRQTPSLNAMLRQVVFNPSWGVPPTILKKDVKGGLSRSGSSYLARKGLHAFTHSGKPVPASQITAANAGNYLFRQPPGPRNALGLVKFDMPNKHDIYLHDTPNREDFRQRDRAKSSGCVRLQHPKELAAYLLNELEQKATSQQRIDSITATRKTSYQKISTPVMVHVVYLTAFPDSSMQYIRFLPDIYGRDARLQAALMR